MQEQEWQKARDFHGHACPGLAIGVKVCQAVRDKLGMEQTRDEELVCLAENDTCAVDAIQVLLGCTLGKGNLIYQGTGKQAFTFMSRKTGKAWRFYFQSPAHDLAREQYQTYLLNTPASELFACREVEAAIPEKARLFTSVICEACGEAAAEQNIRLRDGKKVCLPCFAEYSRGW